MKLGMRRLGLGVAVLGLVLGGAAQAHAQTGTQDPRVGLRAGLTDAGEAISNMVHVGHTPRPEGFINPDNPGDLNFANSDLAFRGSHVVVGNFGGFQIYDVSDPANPVLRTALICPGGQGDVSIAGNLVFMSVEQPRGRIDCGVDAPAQAVSPERFLGVRVFDISDMDRPRQVAAIQTCRGSHTHSLLQHPGDSENIYVYVAGAVGRVRPEEELAGCIGAPEDPRTALFRIEVIRVPLAAPQNAAVVSEPRVFADQAGNIAGLWAGGDHGPETQRTAVTNHCHDITTYPELGLAAGACSGNGILLDVSDPVSPRRIDEVIDPNFAYWHSATFNNDGTTVIFTDEWGGGTQPRCRVTDRPEWGANAIFRVVDGAMELAGYYKLPAAQTETENCVAHNGSLVPVPGRDIKVQAWYQGGISVFDFTDPENPFEIAYFDRGPISAERLYTGGYWSAYWYNGHVYGSEIARGLDIFTLSPSEHLSQNEIDAANLIRWDEFNPQHQPRLSWPANATVARAYLDQLERSGGLQAGVIAGIRGELDGTDRARLASRATDLEASARGAQTAGRAIDARRIGQLADTLRRMAGEQQ
ncbi:MAG TPA: hypothetical protein VK929_08620 [Longimicrobiales bacterium]|nr:hypothetical protein [Longimicrobiales bacterium]